MDVGAAELQALDQAQRLGWPKDCCRPRRGHLLRRVVLLTPHEPEWRTNLKLDHQVRMNVHPWNGTVPRQRMHLFRLAPSRLRTLKDGRAKCIVDSCRSLWWRL